MLTVICACALSVTATDVFAQNRSITGSVRSIGGDRLVGVTVVVQGTNTATFTDAAGSFTLDAAPGSVLQVSYPGFVGQNVTVGEASAVTITLLEDVEAIDEVVVTALGIKRAERALSYNVQTVGGDELTTVRSSNFVNSLAGKVAGVQINSTGGPGGAIKVIARGTKSLSGNNNVLYVVDGIPLRRTSTVEVTHQFAEQPGVEGISDINPDDIESLSMLTGPAAAALYGSDGANGVVLITTRKGASGKTSVTLGNNTTFSTPFVTPEFQNRYGSSAGNSYRSWGEKTDRRFTPNDFFRTGYNTATSVSLQTGNDRNQAYFSAANTTSEGMIPNNTYERNNFGMRYTTLFAKDRLQLDLSANYIIQKDRNMISQGWYSPVPSVYLFPRGDDWNEVRNFERWNGSSGLMEQYWPYAEQSMVLQNPYWTANRMNRTNSRKRYMMTASLKWDIAEWLDVIGRVNVDNTHSRNTREYAATTTSLLAGSKGFYDLEYANAGQTYADVIVNLNKSFGDFNLFANVGGSVKRQSSDGMGVEGQKTARNFAGLNSITNLDRGTMGFTQTWEDQQVQSVFANAELGWKSTLYLTLTARNDWDSTLARTGLGGTPSYFYPSVGLSALFNEMFDMPGWFDFAKLRVSRTEVGSGLSPYVVYPSGNPYYTYDAQRETWSMSTAMPLTNPKPERTASYEVGADLRFWGGALTLDATYYLSNTYNQLFSINMPTSSGYSTMQLQAGNVRNSGMELTLGFNRRWGDFGWRSVATYSFNDNRIKQLATGTNPVTGQPIEMEYNDMATNLSDGRMRIRLMPGGTMSDLYYRDYKWKTNADGSLALNGNGNPEVVENGSGEFTKAGQMSARSYANWSNTFSYKGVEIGVQLRARIGGLVVSNTQAFLDRYGVSEASAAARDAGGVKVHGATVPAETYYNIVAAGWGLGRDYVYNATNVRLGEVSISYALPRKWFDNVMGVSVGLVGNNLAMLYNKAPYDPEQLISAGETYYNNIDFFMQPSARNIGFNIKVQF